MIGVLDSVLAALLVLLAAWSVVARKGTAAVVAYLAYGLLLTLAWIQLHGIDVALTEAAIGGGLTSVLLLGAAATLQTTAAGVAAETAGRPTRWLAGVASAMAAAGIAACVLALPEPAPTLAPDVLANLAVTEVRNPITAVLLVFRAMDTLLEAIVLLFALIGVWSLAPDRAWGGRPGAPPQANPDGVLAYAARVLPPLGLVAGIYIFWIGADHPGGKFQGATLLAAMWLLVLMAGLAEAPPVRRAWLRWLLVAGPLAFIAIGLAGALHAGAFLAYPRGMVKPLILAVEFALMPTLTLVLALMLLGAPQRGDTT